MEPVERSNLHRKSSRRKTEHRERKKGEREVRREAGKDTERQRESAHLKKQWLSCTLIWGPDASVKVKEAQNSPIKFSSEKNTHTHPHMHA